MKNALKLIWYYVRKCGTLLGIQLIITLLGFVIMLIPNDTALTILGIVVVLLNGFMYFLVGKSAALNDFKFKRINLSKFGGNTPVHESCREMKLSKAIIIAASFYVFILIFILVGAFADSVVMRAIPNFAFMGIMLIASGTGFLTTVNGVAADVENGIAAVAGKPYLFPALFVPLIFLTCACYVAGYYISMRTRNRLHREINEEIEMFNRMGKA